MAQCRLCPFVRKQQGQVQPPGLTDVTRGNKAKAPQSLLPTDMRKGAGKGGKGKAKGKGTYGGGASQPTTYHEVRQAIEQNLPLLRDAEGVRRGGASQPIPGAVGPSARPGALSQGRHWW